MNQAEQARRTREFLNEVGDFDFVNGAAARIESPAGGKYYDPAEDLMAFEKFGSEKLWEMAEEELLDFPNYVWMLLERGVLDPAKARGLLHAAYTLWRMFVARREETRS